MEVNGKTYAVKVSPQGAVQSVSPAQPKANPQEVPVSAPLAGTIYKIQVQPGQQVAAGEVVVILEAMKMETEVRAPSAGTVQGVHVKEGDSVQVGDVLLTLR